MYPGEANLGHEHVGAPVQSRLPGARRPTQRGQVAAPHAQGFRKLAGLGPGMDGGWMAQVAVRAQALGPLKRIANPLRTQGSHISL